jgi:Zn-dependent protease with chaperone function
VVTVHDLLVTIPWPGALVRSGAVDVLAIGGIVLLYVFLPVALRYIWKTRRMEDGPLRRRLADLCRRADMPCSDILVWDTFGGHVVNACVTGITRFARYVMVTDALMDALDPLEIEAVFAHEIGHVKRHHMSWYVLFALAFVAGLLVFDPAELEFSAGLAGELVSLDTLVLLVATTLYWGLGFGVLSRRMELESDLYAAELVGEPTAFVSALERIAFFSGRARSAGNWRHFSIAKRTQFVLDCAGDPAKAARFKRRMRLVRAVLVVLAVAGVVAAALSYTVV